MTARVAALVFIAAGMVLMIRSIAMGNQRLAVVNLILIMINTGLFISLMLTKGKGE